MKVRLGTRGSQLALVQAGLVADRLRAAGHEVEVMRIVTEGDLRPIDMVAGDGVFVAAIARALIAGEVDVAVHSAKDVPLEEEAELVIAAYPERADARDALVTRERGASLDSLPPGCSVGTDSPRRAGFVRAARPDLRVVPIHGNVDTRLRRLDEGEVDALILAAAGLDRLGRADRIDQRLDARTVTPAPAQGALAIQARRSDTRLRSELSAIDNPSVRLAVNAERAVLEATGGTCRAPVGAFAVVDEGDFEMLVGGVNSDGTGLHLSVTRSAVGGAMDAARQAGLELKQRVALR
ncbi:MAG TPA: hydroxymethylbilane synthase [Candidatus Dormibacteraeota bacterium]|nr:hydroxymethylbilane synthase [Candidatus Dormibacteraeota bacterium]